jgi:high affinity Mn2+ porin
VFQLSKVPNSTKLDTDFRQYSAVGEIEERHQWRDHDGKFKFLFFVNRGNMASYVDAVALAAQTGGPADVTQVRHFASRPGIAFNFEQEVAADFGVFARASMNDGNKETFDFTDINRSISGGVVFKGDRWGRHDDNFGIAAVVNGISSQARAYFAAGGLGLLVGDGQLVNYGLEKIVEAYYSAHIAPHLTISADYQYVTNPAYSRDRGPVSIFAIRLHAEF